MDRLGPLESPPVDRFTIMLCLFGILCIGFLAGLLVERHLL